MEINPQGAILPEDGIIDNRNPLYLRHGGNIRLFSQRGFGYEIWEETLGLIIFGEGNNPPNTCSIGIFPQWHKFFFYAKDYETGQIYYPLDWGIADEGSNPGWVGIHPSYVPGDPLPYTPDISFVVFVDADYSLAAMPPGEILQYFGDPILGNPFLANPFVPSKKINIPIDGDIFAVVQYANTAISDLWVEYPNEDSLLLDSLLFEIVGTNIGDTIYLGKKFAGDSINFFIRSSNSIVNESKLYPLNQFEENVMPDGDILMWKLLFEDWTDLYFDNLSIDIYFRPDSSADYSPLLVTFKPSNLSPGDTAQIIINRQYLDGTVVGFPEWHSFEIGMIEGCEGGQILYGDSLAPYFSEVYQPIYFVADSSITDTSITVGVRVGLIDQIIEGRPITKNGNQNEAEIISENNKRINKPNTNKTNPPNSPLLNPVSFCFNGTIEQNQIGDGYGVVGNECDKFSNIEYDINYILNEVPEYFVIPSSDLDEIKLPEIISVCNEDENPNAWGASVPIDYRRYRYNYNSGPPFLNSWQLEPYKAEDKKVHYNFLNPQNNQPTSIIFDFVTGVCYLKINPTGAHRKILIENLSDINSGENSKIPSDDYEQAFYDFCGHRCYGVEAAAYALIEVIQIHEREHMSDFAGVIKLNFPTLVEEIKNYSNDCDSYDEEIRKNAEKVIYYKLVKFINDAKKMYNVLSGKPGSEEESEHEKSIQKRDKVVSKIIEYENKLKMRFPQLIGKNCHKCKSE